MVRLNVAKYEAVDAKDNFERRIFSLSEPCTSGADLIIVVTAVMVASTGRVTLARFVVVETFITPGNRRAQLYYLSRLLHNIQNPIRISKTSLRCLVSLHFAIPFHMQYSNVPVVKRLPI